jgi:hypothetical protein
VFRRRHLPDHLRAPFEAFEAIVPPLERAKAALTESVPGTRLPGRPLAETVLEFEEELGLVRAGMDGWRVPEVEAEWEAASAALDEALGLARRLRLEAEPPVGFEQLVATIADLIAPLEGFEAVEARFKALRV